MGLKTDVTIPAKLDEILCPTHFIYQNITLQHYINLASSPDSPIFSTVHKKRGGVWYANHVRDVTSRTMKKPY